MTRAGRRRALDPFPRRAPFDADAPIPLTLFGINEAVPGPRWQALFAATWPGYRRWYLQRDVRERPTLALAVAKLAEHMPELVPTYRRMVALATEAAATETGVTGTGVAGTATQGGAGPDKALGAVHDRPENRRSTDDVAARMLTLWDPPRFLPGCSQAVLTTPEIALCRNYDYSPELWERVVYASEFTGRQVIGNSDCLWGLLDGMNSDGLVVSLSFGGRRGSGPGFAVSLVVRYVLETAASTEEARRILARIPVAMAYNITVVDAEGRVLTAYVAPDRQAEFSTSAVATNHRGEVPDSVEHAERFASVPRRDRLAALVADEPAAADLVQAFLQPPLYSTQYWRAFGTVYTALYRPGNTTLELHWPDRRWVRTFDDPDGTFDVVLRPS